MSKRIWKCLLFLSLVIIIFSGFRFHFFLKNPPKKDFVELPVQFIAQAPCWEIEIEGRPLLVEIDTGLDGYFSLRKEALDQISNKIVTDQSKIFDVNGNMYEHSSFIIPEIKLGKALISRSIVMEESMFFLTKGCSIHPDQEPSPQRMEFLEKVGGRIGAGIFGAQDYWLMDLGNSSVYVIRDLEEAQKKKVFCLENFLEVPFELDSSHLVISMETDFGWKKWILDTGAGLSVMRAESEEDRGVSKVSQKFSWANTNLGPIDIYFYQMTEQLNADGILGIDFFLKHAIFLDFKNQKAYIGPSGVLNKQDPLGEPMQESGSV